MVMCVAKTTIWTHGLHWVSIMCGQESGLITGYSSIKIGAVCCSCLNKRWSVDVLSLCGCFKLPDDKLVCHIRVKAPAEVELRARSKHFLYTIVKLHTQMVCVWPAVLSYSHSGNREVHSND